MSSRLNSGYNYIKRNPWPLLLFLLGAVIRILYLGSIPPGLNQDEASIGYDAYAILHFGMDRNGVHLPIHLIAWGSGQNALYAYLSMPFILLFGLTPMSVRAVSLIMGLVGMVIFYLMARQLFVSRGAGLAAMFFIAINPWHIMMSRWALESNLFPTLILLAVYFLLKSLVSSKWSYGFSMMLALSLYAYGTAYFFVPIFALGTLILLLYRRVINFRTVLWNIALFILLALPILIFIIINRMKLPGVETPLFSIPRLTMPRMDQVSSVFSGQIVHTALSNFNEFIKLLLSGSDGLPWNSISPYGYAYPIALPFALIGLMVLIKAVRNRDQWGTGQAVILLWLLVAVLMTFITDVNINRINVIFYPLVLLVVAGFMWLSHKLRAIGILSAAVFSLFFILFTTFYFRDFPQNIGPAFYESIGEALHYASEESTGKIYVTDEVNMPYIYVLFYERINPHDFLKTVNYVNPGDAFQKVASFDRYVFGYPNIVSGESAAYIFGNGDSIPAESENYTIKRFANYTVVIAKSTAAGAISSSDPAEPESMLSDFVNGNFEEGKSGWRFTEGTGVATNNSYKGSYLGYLDLGTGTSITQFFLTKESGEYKLSAMVSAGGEGGRMGIRTKDTVLAEAEITAGDAYHALTLPAFRLDQNQQAEIYITGGTGWINIDEVKLER
ncbi:glycosyltransferase family 39 protein [Paenibacillus monticola]|uniref:Glycosyltransferase RgtA/B/C/D-like domain-containing protein n=1 Tax=Paenibacillus monticola TaxID=2666075 RepID=A0A7X2L4Q3_9BACL|nr:glycosyltransferase family 39 protein [Paenibacillus monticola]MRN55581.1 hypothetical protein [Paenibacillus monticola]